MKSLIGLLSVLLLSSAFDDTAAEVKDGCKHLLHRLAACQQDYLRCSTSHAVPVQLCMGCSIEYLSMKEAYKNLTADQNCSKEYFDHDRINVVATTQNMLLDLWKKAHCDDCLRGNNSEIFGKKMDNLTYCFMKHNSDEEKCAYCLNQYLDLNFFYKSLDQHNNGQVCYDLQDAMNQTRVQWSTQFKCCQRKFRMTLFLVATIGIGSLPVIFYASAYILTKRRERNHSVLNIEEDISNNTQIVGHTPANQQSQNLVEPPTEDTEILKKNMQSDEYVDSSDDENMPKMQKLT